MLRLEPIFFFGGGVGLTDTAFGDSGSWSLTSFGLVSVGHLATGDACCPQSTASEMEVWG